MEKQDLEFLKNTMEKLKKIKVYKGRIKSKKKNCEISQLWS